MLRNIKKQSAFTLVEIMIAVSIVILISGLSIHSLLRAKITANEAAAMKNLRTLYTAFASYRIANPTYPSDLNVLTLATPPYVDNTFASGTRQGYRFTIEDVDANTFMLAAAPVNPGVTGVKSFSITEAGDIMETVSGITTGIGGGAN